MANSIVSAAKDALSRGGAVVNYQHYPWWWAMAMGWLKLVTGCAAALADTFSSGFFFLALFDLLAPGLTTAKDGMAVWIVIISMFFSLCFYLAAESAMFMGSGHYETVAASRASDMHGEMKRKPTHSGVNEFFTRHRVLISTFSMVYMVTTDFIGFYKIEWTYIWTVNKGDVLSPAMRFLLLAPVNAIIAGFLFFWALNGVLWGAQQVEYAWDEKYARRRLLLVADRQSGLPPGLSAMGAPKQIAPGSAKTKQLPAGQGSKATDQKTTVHLAQSGSSIKDW